MGKAAGFMEYPRIGPEYRPVQDRIQDYREFVSLLPEDEAIRQGARCMDCGVPYCHLVGCPLYNVVPDINDFVYRGEWQLAYQKLESTNPFPEITGRVCPALCEAACTLAVNTSPVAVRQLELFVIEKAFEKGWVVPHPPSSETGKRVAVIGSGPAGLAAAQALRRLGHSVVVYEKSEEPGGILRFGIPDFKLEKRVIERRLDQMRAEGVRFETGVSVGDSLAVKDLRESCDAVVLAAGAGTPRDLNIPGRDLQGVHFAMDYLMPSNRFVSGTKSKNEIIWAEGKNVLVIGGGDTGADCVGTAVRQKAKKVTQFEILPQPVAWDKPFNPEWPDWPKVLRTSSSHDEGCERDWSVLTHQFTGVNGRLTQGRFARVEWKSAGPGRPPEMREVPGSEFTLDIDLAFLAMGFVHVDHGPLVSGLGVGLDERGNVRTDGNYGSTVPGVFVAGDAMTGASLVVRALWHGRGAAKACHEFLQRDGGKRSIHAAAAGRTVR